MAKALGIATVTADGRLRDASAAVHQHPRLLGLVGTGRVSMGGLGRVIEATRVLDPARQRRVDEQVAAEARRRRMSPGELGNAAARRVLQIDPDAADRRAARARRRRDVRLGDPVDGTAQLIATLRAEDALAVHTRLDRTARGMRQSGDQRPLDLLRADLFVEHLAGRSMVPTGPGEQAAGVALDRRVPAVDPHLPTTSPATGRAAGRRRSGAAGRRPGVGHLLRHLLRHPIATRSA